MIKAKLPTWEKSLNEDETKVIVKDKDILIIINTSIEAEKKWETEFKENAKAETLFAYISRIVEKDKKDIMANSLSALKALYCLIESDDVTTFKQFCSLFDFSEKERFTKLIDKMTNVFNLALNSSTADEKN
jgi:hypothetical protein